MLDAHNPVDRASAETLLSWLLAPDEHGEPHAMARRAGIDYLIWDKRIWSSRTLEWQPYDGFDAAGQCVATGGCRDPHTNHVHVSFSWPGARAETSFYDWLQHGPHEVNGDEPPPPEPAEEPKPEETGWHQAAVFLVSAGAGYLAVRAAQRSWSGVGRTRATRRS
jgi:hypothetical protein